MLLRHSFLHTLAARAAPRQQQALHSPPAVSAARATAPPIPAAAKACTLLNRTTGATWSRVVTCASASNQQQLNGQLDGQQAQQQQQQQEQEQQQQPQPMGEEPANWGHLHLPRLPGSKRTVAMHLAYVGTAFKGLQINRDSARDQTVEGALELALLRAGLIAPTNFGGDMFRLKWSRSSRTDKGVHSISTVIGARLVLQDVEETYANDPEGLGIASRINQELPPSVQVLCVQRVNKKFSARKTCKARTYHYYLPTDLLGLKCDGSQEDAEKLNTLRSALAAFVGRHPFHNFTPRKGQTVQSSLKQKSARWKARKDADRTLRGPARNIAAAAEALSRSAPMEQPSPVLEALQQLTGTHFQQPQSQELQQLSQSHSQEQSLSQQQQQGQQEGGQESHVSSSSVAADSNSSGNRQQQGRGESGASSSSLEEEEEGVDGSERSSGRGGESDDEEEEEDENEEGSDDDMEAMLNNKQEADENGQLQPFVQTCQWKDSFTPEERVQPQLYRVIHSFTAGEPRTLVPGGVPCVLLEVEGQSFLLNHIRHMIGAAIAVVRGKIPMELLKASLHAPVRVTVPKAPPHSLILADSHFTRFSSSGGEPKIAKYTGPRLMLREGAQRKQQQFFEQVLSPTLNQLLQHEDYAYFLACESRYVYEPSAVTAVLEADAEWCKKREGLMQRRAQEKEERRQQRERQRQGQERKEMEQKDQKEQMDVEGSAEHVSSSSLS